jgi:purine-nucleoside phosphorylase
MRLGDSIFNPDDFIRYIANVCGIDVDFFRLPGIAYIVFNSRMLEEFVDGFGAVRRSWLYRDEIDPICNPYIANVGGRDVVFILPGWGAPRATAVMEEMIVCGVEKFIVLGLCGSLSTNLDVGDIVVASKALIDEGTSNHYIPNKSFSYPDEGLYRLILDVLDELNIGYSCGGIWSTDAPYRETREKVLRYREMGVICVDMETSALFTLGEYRGVKVASIHIVSDDLSTLVWRPAFRTRIIYERYSLLKDVIGRLTTSL